MSALTSDEKLVRMANQIASFFRSYPDDEAVTGIHKHVVAFWTPKMLASLEACLPAMGERVDPLVVRAMREGRTEAESPVRSATRDPQKLGEGASDAG
ncbi:formate dehydrogenase subunit delta [Methylobacterium sp. E-041]|jgi:formate dehydrogenase subunit delta|uniref:formate dehydrogenase subunit delta n=1 Tax=unclassified Methylobacterium TaxID=2615210 RepID=UPI0011C868BE|nr:MULTISPECIES: formate dehydrogenase subunit delta [unclassified Methylobacterium]MCJ2010296.1 formate dehydrogenase subunit delta [Methylobacterium sp. J-092]MCJ2038410.1 formate dehydrogenase subunit delta [Methylobacterium sp. J-059]MCJ2076541.1 formate dehydrogenase subunit delta [Methylobacterium sp. E-016]MCJ2108666.1 formate dehydrogenase subunit delta [Methylobacterium sp. E-041]MCJ2114336.1 formate dehydrogenase subunit delta [Methylobacterium sp. E-025]